MKKSRIAKFALMGASLAALAATLGTSTYAWYVTNSTATAGNIGMQTSASGSGNLLLAQAKNNDNTLIPGNFSQTLNLTGGNIVGAKQALFPYTPGTYVANTGTLTADATLTNWVDADGNAVSSASTKCYAEFKIWVMSTDNATVNYSLTLKNTTAAKTTQVAYSLEGLGTTPVVSALYTTFGVDATHALRFAVTKGTTTEDTENGGWTYAIPNGASYTIYDENAATVDTPQVNTWDNATGMDANQYYYSILGINPIGCTVSNNTISAYSIADPSAESITALTLTANKPELLQFRVWLEGTDSMCFDSCGGQSFTFDFSFAKQVSGNNQNNG